MTEALGSSPLVDAHSRLRSTRRSSNCLSKPAERELITRLEPTAGPVYVPRIHQRRSEDRSGGHSRSCLHGQLFGNSAVLREREVWRS